MITYLFSWLQSFFPAEPKPMIENYEEPIEEPVVLTSREQLLEEAKRWFGKEASPLDPVDDNLACVDSLTNIVREVYPDFPKVYHTALLVRELNNSPHFVGTLDLKPGNIIVNATGSGNGKIRGHAGIIGESKIYANDSRTGLWLDYYDINTWTQRYRRRGEMPTRVFEAVG